MQKQVCYKNNITIAVLLIAAVSMISSTVLPNMEVQAKWGDKIKGKVKEVVASKLTTVQDKVKNENAKNAIGKVIDKLNGKNSNEGGSNDGGNTEDTGGSSNEGSDSGSGGDIGSGGSDTGGSDTGGNGGESGGSGDGSDSGGEGGD